MTKALPASSLWAWCGLCESACHFTRDWDWDCPKWKYLTNWFVKLQWPILHESAACPSGRQMFPNLSQPCQQLPRPQQRNSHQLYSRGLWRSAVWWDLTELIEENIFTATCSQRLHFVHRPARTGDCPSASPIAPISRSPFTSSSNIQESIYLKLQSWETTWPRQNHARIRPRP